MIEFIYSNLSWLWLAILVICLIAEAFTFALTTIWAAIAAVPFIFVARTSLPFRWQLLGFALLTVILIVFTRPFAVKRLRQGKINRTNVNAMEGQEVIVVKDISDFEKGSVKAKNGVIWQAVSSESAIKAGTVCTVTGIEGNTLIVKEKKIIRI